MRPSIKSLQSEIEALKARVLDADQCAARALQGRDQYCKALEAAERQLKNPSPNSPLLAPLRQELTNTRAAERRMWAKARALGIQLRIARAQLQLFRHRATFDNR